MNDPGDETDFHDVAGANVALRYIVGVRTDEVLEAVRDERARQNVKWGRQNHEPGYWNAVLGEEFGEASEAMLNFVDLGPLAPSPKKPGISTASHYRQELIHVAAVAVAMIEQLDRESEAREAMIRRMPPGEQDAWRNLLS